MNKYFGWAFAAIASLTLVSAFADDADNEATSDGGEDQVAVVVEQPEDSE